MESDDDFKLSKRKAHNEADNKRDNLVEDYPIRRTLNTTLNTKKKVKAGKDNAAKARKSKFKDIKTIVEPEVPNPLEIQSPVSILCYGPQIARIIKK